MRRTSPKRLAPRPEGSGSLRELAAALKNFRLSDHFSRRAIEVTLCVSVALSVCALVMLFVSERRDRSP